MCGLVGIAGNLAHKDEATMKRLFLLDYFRGVDATGFAAVTMNDDVRLAKINSHPIDLFDMLRFKAALSGHASKVFLGHNRAKTVGNNTTINAHPFHYEHIVGAHNGTLDTKSFRDLEKLAGEEFEVDSQAVFACIAKVGIEETIKVMEGAWALVWYDTDKRTLNFIRNDKRPLWYSYSKDFKRLFWASEYLMIDNALKMAGSETDYELYQTDKGHCYFPLAVDTLHTFKVGDIVTATEKVKPTIKALKGREPLPTAVGSPFAGGGASGGSTTPTTTRHSTTTTTSRTTSADPLKHFVGSPANPFAGLLTESQFLGCTKHGCNWCGEELNWGDVGLTHYEMDHVTLCRTCSGSGNFNRVFVEDIKLFL